MMRMRFEIDVERSPARFIACCFERKNLRVLRARVSVGSLADNLAMGIGDQRADVRIGRGQANSCARQFQRALKQLIVLRMDGHSA